ncbi:hypothetical protein ABN764_13325 [Paenibacillaceae sp. P-4]|uniref:hypothetical protein n=1 Tax=Paenibacillaceae bacterium P-4 TaxID=3160969 RepID=UPI0032E83A74
MEELHQRFLEQQLPRRYTNLAAEKMLVEKYRAIEIPAEVLADLQRDPLANFEQVFKCFKIEDRDVLNRIYSDTEKGIQEEHKARYEEREAEDRPWNHRRRNGFGFEMGSCFELYSLVKMGSICSDLPCRDCVMH